MPVSLVSLVDDKRQFFKSIQDDQGLAGGQRETPLSHSFCQTVVIDQAPLVVTDAENDPRVSDNLAIPDLGVKAYLGVPLVVSGHVIGSLCAIDTTPRTWDDNDLKTLSDVAEIVMSEIGLRDEIRKRRAAEGNQDLLIAELNHRVKNTLATVQALIPVKPRRSPIAGPVSRKHRGAHRLARQNAYAPERQQWRAIGFRTLLTSELAPYEGDGRIRLHGPDFDLEAEIATTLGMVIHELTTNSAKYGALSVSGGKVAVEWNLQDSSDGQDKTIDLTWRESGGPPIIHSQPIRGFGSKLIERLIGKQFGGITTFDFAPAGLIFHATMAAPQERPPGGNLASQAFDLTKR